MIDNISDKTDEELAVLALESQAGFLHLVNRYQGKLLSYILKISSFSREEAEDVLQEVFIKVYKNLNDFNPDLKFSSWVYRIAHNQVISHYRKYHKTQKATIDINDQVLDNLSDDLDIGRNVDIKFLRKDIEKALARLDQKYKEVLVLRFLEEKDYKEISDILEKPMGTVSALINRAKENIKKELQKYE